MPVKVAVMCLENECIFESLTEAAAYAGVPVQQIARSCSEGLAVRGLHYERVHGGGRMCTQDRLRRNAKMRKDHEGGMSIGEVAAKYQLSYQAAANVIKGADVDARKKRDMAEREKRDRRILKDHEKGLTYNELAKAYGLSRAGIELCLRRARGI